MHVEGAEARWPTHRFGQARRELQGRRIALLFHRYLLGGELNYRYIGSGAIAVFNDRSSRNRQYAWMLVSKPLQCHRDRINVGRLKLDELDKPCHIPPPLRSSYRLTRYDLGKIPARRPQPSGEAGAPGPLLGCTNPPRPRLMCRLSTRLHVPLWGRQLPQTRSPEGSWLGVGLVAWAFFARCSRFDPQLQRLRSMCRWSGRIPQA